jgi:hypothetical protein
MLVKTISLPKFTPDVKTFNAYNRPNIIQTKLKYEPVQMTFHDDSDDVVRVFWYSYLSYYFRDTDYQENTYNQPTKYGPQKTQDWGYQPAKYAPNGPPNQVIKSIRIYSLHQQRFTEYVLINPTISSFTHGEHAAGASEPMIHSMTVQYETVLYNYGDIVPDSTVSGFALLHYDFEPSPETYGRSQLPVAQAYTPDGTSKNLADGTSVAANSTSWPAYNNYKGPSVGSSSGVELTQIGQNVLTNSNPGSRLQIPSLGGITSGGFGQRGGAISGAIGGAGGLNSVIGLLGGQRGGIPSIGGFSNPSTIMATAGTQISQLTRSISRNPANAIGLLKSNGESIAGKFGFNNPVPRTPNQTLPNGSSVYTNPVSGYTYTTSADGIATYADDQGTPLSQYDSNGNQFAIDDGQGGLEGYEPGPNEADAQAFDGEDTNMNTDATYDAASDQGDSLFA